MPSYEQLPGRLNLAFRAGDDFATLIDFDPITMTGYTVTANVYSYVSGATVADFATTLSNASAGQVNIALTDTQTAAIPAGTYGWRLQWTDSGGGQRTALTGFAEVSR